MIFLKSVLGGIGATVIMWLAVLGTSMWRLEEARKQQGGTGLGAVAGGWSYLLRSPLVVILLTAAFGVGLYLTARWISN
jgi:hypothetical protein